MLHIDNDYNIILLKGDSGSFNISINDRTGNRYVPDIDDDINFVVKNGSTTILNKNISSSLMILSISNSDTQNLTVGDYTYSIVKTNSGNPDTLLSGKFIVSSNNSNVGYGSLSSVIDMTGTLSNTSNNVSGKISGNSILSGNLNMAAGPSFDVYDGSYEITPDTDNNIVLDSKLKFLHYDVVIKQIPYYETSNQTGTTVYIGG